VDNFRILILRGLIFASLEMGLAAPAASAEPAESQVVDSTTGTPIAGAIVLARYGADGQWHEAETDGAGAFMVDRPAGVAADDVFVAVYKYGYTLWNNQSVLRFDVPIRPGVIFSPPAERQDKSLPARIRLEPFPANGNWGVHAWFLKLFAEGDGKPHLRPKFARAIEREIGEAERKRDAYCRRTPSECQ